MSKKRKNNSAPLVRRPTPSSANKMPSRPVGLGIQYSGPLPDPVSFAKYEQIIPGAAERIISMAEAEQKHRHETESKAVDAQVEDMKKAHIETKRAQWLAFTLAGLLTLLAAFLVYTGHPGHGTAVAVSTIVGVITAFLGDKKTTKK